MITLIVDKMAIGEKREIFNNLTLKELGEKLTELSAKYVLVFDTVRNIIPEGGCDLYISVATKR